MSYACNFLQLISYHAYIIDSLVFVFAYLISELNDLFLLQTVFAGVKVFRPVVHVPSTPSILNNDEENLSPKNPIPLVATERIRSLRGATKT